MRPALRYPALPLLLVLLMLTSCGGSRTGDTGAYPAPVDQPQARIENRSSIDMDIFLVRTNGQRHRLGFVSGSETATFALPLARTTGTTAVTFEARPVRSSGQPVVSELFGVRPGEEITWSISPQ